MEKLSKYSLYLLTVYGIAVVIAAIVLWNDLLLTQKCAAMVAVVAVLHEWEEQRFPGGFYEMIAGRIGIKATSEQMHKMLAVPDIMIFVLTGLAFIVRDVPLFACAAILFGIVEGIVHLAGIKLAHTKKPYTPGMATAEIWACTSIVSIVLIAQSGMAGALDWVLGAVWMIVCFLAMEMSIWKMAGITPSKMRESMFGQRSK